MLERLTPREQQVAQCLARGWSNKNIAEELGVSEGTVKRFIGMIKLRLGITGRGRVEIVNLLKPPAELISEEERNRRLEVFFSLNARRRKGARLIQFGHSYRTIAEILGTTENAVKMRVAKAVFDVVGVNSRLQLANWLTSINISPLEA